MNILLFGKNGMVGHAVQSQAKKYGISVAAYGREKADFTKPEQCADIISECDTDVIINAAAYTAVDKAEEDQDLAYLINAETPAKIAQAAKIRDIPLVHISTDYIFNSRDDKPIDTDHITSPINHYGATKLAGEEAIINSGCAYTILRTSWVFSNHGNNFVKTMIRLAESHKQLSVVADQYGGPTSAYSIADACINIARYMQRGDKGGIYHFSGKPDVSWAGFARKIFELSDHDIRVNNISTADYPTPAKRPQNSRLNCDSTLQNFNIDRPLWQNDLARILKELKKV